MKIGCVLITGAAGRIGSALTAHLQDRFSLRLADLPEVDLTVPDRHEKMTLHCEELDECRRACAGIHTVVHLAANPSGRAEFYQGLLKPNILGTYNIFEAAREAGCRRVIFASSIQAIDGYPLDVQVRPEDPVGPSTVYGATKVWGEALAYQFAHAHGLSCIAVRIGSFGGNRTQREGPRSARHLSSYVSSRDLCGLLERCIAVPDIRFAIVSGISDNRFKRMDADSTRKLLGFRPQDDAFERFQAEWHEIDRWRDERERT